MKSVPVLRGDNQTSAILWLDLAVCESWGFQGRNHRPCTPCNTGARRPTGQTR